MNKCKMKKKVYQIMIKATPLILRFLYMLFYLLFVILFICFFYRHDQRKLILHKEQTKPNTKAKENIHMLTT